MLPTAENGWRQKKPGVYIKKYMYTVNAPIQEICNPSGFLKGKIKT